MKAEPTPEHRWLQRLVGDWAVETQFEPGSEEPGELATGTETVRSIGELWVAAEGRGGMPGGDEGHWVMTVGFDPGAGRFVGTWVGSMMTWMFVYEGSLDDEERVLTLETRGPDMEGRGSDTPYRDVIAIEDDDVRTMTSLMRGEDGAWSEIMKTTFRRQT